ncbi:hypothetical protein GOODEAATRI_026787 [Goodea atripinnis]|uniref:Armadillo repeat-containing protein 1 n=1 Tax=Goodea atripinnis TaxID=208336 RepID=A0ABV0PHG2_9TELE
MSAEPDPLAVVNQLRDLAADPMNRRAIVQDHGCLPGLILFMDHPNPQVVYSALLVSPPLSCWFQILGLNSLRMLNQNLSGWCLRCRDGADTSPTASNLIRCSQTEPEPGTQVFSADKQNLHSSLSISVPHKEVVVQNIIGTGSICFGLNFSSVSLQAIRYLAECRPNREKLKGELGMMLSLQNVVQK